MATRDAPGPGPGPGDGGYTLLFDVWLLANSTRALIDDAIRPSGLTADEFAIYSALKQEGGVTPSTLATLMALPPTTVSSIVRRLERRGHVRRSPRPGDARSYRIQLTAAGHRAHGQAAGLFAPLLARVESRLGTRARQARAALSDLDAAVRSAAGAAGL